MRYNLSFIFIAGDDWRRKQPISSHDEIFNDNWEFRRVHETGRSISGRREWTDPALRRFFTFSSRVEQVQELAKVITAKNEMPQLFELHHATFLNYFLAAKS